MAMNSNTNFIPSQYFDYFFYWACERQNIFWKKYNGEQPPWTDDPILNHFSFTNVYRCLDRVSQYLLRNVIYNGRRYEPEDMFFRILLFKHFNSCATWDALVQEFGDITYETGLGRIADFLDRYINEGNRIYSSAYLITPYFYQRPEYESMRGLSKHRVYLKIFEDEIFQNGHIYDFLGAKSFEGLYNEFRIMKIYGDFMAQQYAIDLNYSPLFYFSENEFVITGPGSLRGIGWTFEGAKGHRYDYVGAIQYTQEHFAERMAKLEKETGVKWNPLPWEPVPTLTNIQNCFCEVGKFAKGLGFRFNRGQKSERIKREYTPNKPPIDYVFPPKWNAAMPERGVVITY